MSVRQLQTDFHELQNTIATHPQNSSSLDLHSDRRSYLQGKMSVVMVGRDISVLHQWLQSCSWQMPHRHIAPPKYPNRKTTLLVAR